MISEFQQKQQSLPIFKYKQQIINTIRQNNVTIICGQTGSGKTTQIPQYIYDSYNKIIVTQPRRISAVTLAERVALEMGFTLGLEVGYNVRFQEKRTPNTKVTFMTDGMAIRQLMVRKHFDVFVLDQAHQRSINTDVLMAVLKKILFETKSNIKIVVMSATIDAGKFMKFFNTDALINVQGRSYPTQVYNLFEPSENYVEAAFNTIMQIHFTQQKGDILVFLTGEDQINGLQKKIQKSKQTFGISNLKVLMLYSALPYEYQHQIFTPQTGSNPPRRVILATNIAETSVTINGVRFVVDCGFMKIRVYDQRKMLDILTVVPLSKANALQRSGRAGRESKGKCFRLYLKNNYDDLPDQMLPEILRSELSGPILQLKAIGITQIASLDFMDRPSDQVFKHCLNLLREIKCLKDEPNETITDYGYQVSKIPLPPVLSHLLISSLEYKCAGIVLSMLSILSVQNLFYTVSRENQKQKRGGVYQIMKKYLPIVNRESLTHSQQKASLVSSRGSSYSFSKKDNSSSLVSDHLAKVNLLHQYINCKSNKSVFCQQNLLNKNNIKRAVLIRDQLQDYLKQILKQRNKTNFFVLNAQKPNQSDGLSVNDSKLTAQSISNWLKCMQKCCIYNIAKLSKEGNYLINKTGQKAYIHPQSLCFYLKERPAVIVFNQIVKTTKTYLRDVTPLNF